jgi:ATP-dependent DNA helicase DinG
MHTPERLSAFQRDIFTEILPLHGFAPRGKQTELADEILSAMQNIGVLLAEAEVGTGKTLAYLLPSVLIRRGRVNEMRLGAVLPGGHAPPIVVATSSIALQRAVVGDCIPMLSDILTEHGIIKTPLTAALRKGKGNYLCERRLANFLNTANRETKAMAEPLMRGSVVDLAVLKGLTPYIKRNVCIDGGCDRDCKRYAVCRYTRMMREVKRNGYDFQVTNHNLLLADVLRRAKGEQPILPDRQAIIIDEAHKFLDAARDMYGAALSLGELLGVAKDVRGFTFEAGTPTADIVRECNRIHSKSRLLFQFLNKEVPVDADEDAERCPTKIRERTEKLMRTLRENTVALREMLSGRSVTAKFERRCAEALRTLARIDESQLAFARHEESVYWLEETAVTGAESPDDARLNLLRGIPKDLGALLHRDLWSGNVPIILTSGTLSAGGDFGRIERKTGLDLLPAKRLSETSKPSPFDLRENTLLYISENTPFPDNRDGDYIDAVAEETERLIRASHGHAAVLFTSYDAMGRVLSKLNRRAETPGANLPYPFFRLDRGSAAEIERFRRVANGVLFSSGALWEGVDIPGDTLSMLIIVRLPFAVPDPVGEWERTLYADTDEYKSKVIVPEMLIKLRQGAGRLIRTETDTGVIAILDRRASRGGAYRSRVLAALPPCRVTASVADVKRFMIEKKPPAYFAEARALSSGSIKGGNSHE